MPTFQQNLRLLTTDAQHAMQALSKLLLENYTRVSDLFASWDLDTDGHVSRAEWWKAISELGLHDTKEHVDALFDAIDTNGSGSIEHGELNELLRQGATITLAEELQDGAAGEIETERTQQYGLRKGGIKDAPVSRFVAELGAKTVEEVPHKLMAFLDQRHERLTDLFHDWDTDEDGYVVVGELARGLRKLGVNLTQADCRWLFGVFDPDGSGKIDVGEFAHLLQSTKSSEHMAELQLRALKKQKLDFHHPKVRALQTADAKREMARLSERKDITAAPAAAAEAPAADGAAADGGEPATGPLSAAERARLALLVQAEALYELELTLNRGRVLSPPELKRFRELALSIRAQVLPNAPPPLSKKPSVLARPQPAWLRQADRQRQRDEEEDLRAFEALQRAAANQRGKDGAQTDRSHMRLHQRRLRDHSEPRLARVEAVMNAASAARLKAAAKADGGSADADTDTDAAADADGAAGAAAAAAGGLGGVGVGGGVQMYQRVSQQAALGALPSLRSKRTQVLAAALSLSPRLLDERGKLVLLQNPTALRGNSGASSARQLRLGGAARPAHERRAKVPHSLPVLPRTLAAVVAADVPVPSAAAAATATDDDEGAAAAAAAPATEVATAEASAAAAAAEAPAVLTEAEKALAKEQRKAVAKAAHKADLEVQRVNREILRETERQKAREKQARKEARRQRAAAPAAGDGDGADASAFSAPHPPSHSSSGATDSAPHRKVRQARLLAEAEAAAVAEELDALHKAVEEGIALKQKLRRRKARKAAAMAAGARPAQQQQQQQQQIMQGNAPHPYERPDMPPPPAPRRGATQSPRRASVAVAPGGGGARAGAAAAPTERVDVDVLKREAEAEARLTAQQEDEKRTVELAEQLQELKQEADAKQEALRLLEDESALLSGELKQEEMGSGENVARRVEMLEKVEAAEQQLMQLEHLGKTYGHMLERWTVHTLPAAVGRDRFIRSRIVEVMHLAATVEERRVFALEVTDATHALLEETKEEVRQRKQQNQQKLDAMHQRMAELERAHAAMAAIEEVKELEENAALAAADGRTVHERLSAKLTEYLVGAPPRRRPARHSPRRHAACHASCARALVRPCARASHARQRWDLLATLRRRRPSPQTAGSEACPMACPPPLLLLARCACLRTPPHASALLLTRPLHASKHALRPTCPLCAAPPCSVQPALCPS